MSMGLQQVWSMCITVKMCKSLVFNFNGVLVSNLLQEVFSCQLDDISFPFQSYLPTRLKKKKVRSSIIDLASTAFLFYQSVHIYFLSGVCCCCPDLSSHLALMSSDSCTSFKTGLFLVVTLQFTCIQDVYIEWRKK